MRMRTSWKLAPALVAVFAMMMMMPMGAGQEPAPASKDPAPAEGKSTTRNPAAKIPEIPPDKLPPRSAPPPDPAKEQHRRDKVWLGVEERVHPKERPAYAPEVRVLEEYLAEYFRRAGFEVVKEPAGARYRIEGKHEARFLQPITFQGQVIAHKYVGSVTVRVLEGAPEANGAEVEKVEVPEFFADGIQIPEKPEEEIAFLEMRRRLAKIVWERLFYVGKIFASPEIPALIATLAADDPENEAPVQAEAAVRALAGRRWAAVPYLIEALGDERVVRVHAVYPRLTSANAEKLRVYHLADKALEEIFQKVSRMDLETTPEGRFVIIKGWENEWRRFCPPYRESPQRQVRSKKRDAAPVPSSP